MLQVSSFSSCTFLHTQIVNISPWLSSMVHNISIDYYCSQNGLIIMELCPLEVNLCQNFTLTFLAITFSYELYFVNNLAHWINPSKLFYLSYKEKVYLGALYTCGF
jgi:hypothetical protein